MSIFGWGKSEDKAPASVDEHSQVLGIGGNDTAPNAGSPQTATVEAARANALNLSATAKRGRPRKDAGTSARDAQTVQAAVIAETARQLEAVHSPKVWGAVLSAPADTAVALTGRKHWEVSKDEREILGETGALAARTMLVTNPRTLALLLISATLFSVYMPRLGKELEHMRAERERKEKEKNAAGN